jgi:hypothetical protein
MFQVLPRHAVSLAIVVSVAVVCLTGCTVLPFGPNSTSTPDANSDATVTPDPDQPSADPAAELKSYQLTGGDGKYQFSGVLCDVDNGGEIPPATAGVTGGANLVTFAGRFSLNWIYGEGNDAQIDTALGKITDISVTANSIRITANYDGYASIGDGGSNTPVKGEIVFEGPRIETPQFCLDQLAG